MVMGGQGRDLCEWCPLYMPVYVPELSDELCEFLFMPEGCPMAVVFEMGEMDDLKERNVV